jgi:hypothetical protein
VTKPAIVDVAKQLAEAHRKEDPQTKEVFLAENADEVRLVEVTRSVESTDGGEVLPFRFARTDKVPYKSVVVLLSEEEWNRVKKGELSLPAGWGTPDTLKKIA